MSNHLYYSRPDEISSAPEFFFTFLSTQSGGLWGYLILLVIFSISYLSLSNFNPRQAFAASSFTTFTATVLMLPFNVVGTFALTLTGLMVVVSLLINRGNNRGGSI